MDCLWRCFNATAAACPSLVYASKPKKKKHGGLRAKLNRENDPLLQVAMDGACLRFQESRRPEPLFVDPYSGCFVQNVVQNDLKNYSDPYCVATKFIDDKLLNTLNHIDGLKQVVLLTDGMDTRPFRLKWPTSTMIFDISPDTIYRHSAEKLKGVGAQVSRSCLLLHIPLDFSSIQQRLCAKGFNGNRPSIWAIQGLPLVTLANFEEILLGVGNLAMNGSLFFGELPSWLAETDIEIRSTEKWMDNLFMNNGFRVNMISYDEVAKRLGKELLPGDPRNVLFVAEQLQFSDDQMETWRTEFQRIEEEGDEEGFEEL